MKRADKTKLVPGKLYGIAFDAGTVAGLMTATFNRPCSGPYEDNPLVPPGNHYLHFDGLCILADMVTVWEGED